MSELPPNWTKASVEDVTTSFMSIDPTRTPDRLFRYVDIGSIDNNTQTITNPKSFVGRDAPSRARRLICTGDTLFSTVRTYLKNIAVVPDELNGELTSTGIAILRSNGAVEANYLFRWVCSDDFVGRLSSAQDGTMYPAVSDRDVAAASIPLPPLAEQRRIVSKIDSLTGKSKRAREHLNHIQRLVEKYKQAVLAAAFRGDLTREVELTYASGQLEVSLHTRIDARISSLPLLPPSWQWSSLGRVANIRGGLTKNAKRTALSFQIPYLRVANVYANRLDLSDILAIGCTESEFKRTKLEKGDLLIVEGNGSLEQIGRVALWSGEIPGCSHQNHLIRARPNPEVLSAYVLFWLLSPLGRAAIETVASSSSGLHTLSLSKVSALPIPLCSISQQKLVVRRIEFAFAYIDRLASEATSARKLVSRLDQAILAKAFRGELVPQDPADEPASVLLKRIHTERIVAPKAKRGRKAAS